MSDDGHGQIPVWIDEKAYLNEINGILRDKETIELYQVVIDDFERIENDEEMMDILLQYSGDDDSMLIVSTGIASTADFPLIPIKSKLKVYDETQEEVVDSLIQ